jgi:hypothetical protein
METVLGDSDDVRHPGHVSGAAHHVARRVIGDAGHARAGSRHLGAEHPVIVIHAPLGYLVGEGTEALFER